ncbi:MAG: UDP-3-O-(3-hydroxymyristoyl)glucosamine N-acyltransferase [Spirosomataceae bacterium]
MQISISTLASWVNGHVEGDPNMLISSVGKIEDAKPGDIAFLANEKYEKFVYTTQATAVLISNSYVLSQKVNATLIRVNDPYLAFTLLLEKVQAASSTSYAWEIHPTALLGKSIELPARCAIGPYVCIADNVQIGEDVRIDSHCFIRENVQIGAGTVIQSGVRILEGTQIGKNCFIKPNAVIGSNGFGYAPQPDGSYRQIPQLGHVVIEDDVQIGANATVDRATLGVTRLCRGVKLDNLIHIGHNVEVGENTVMAAQSGIAGSSKVGKNCMISGQVAISGHLTLADGTQIGGQAGILKTVSKPNSMLFGTPAFDKDEFMKSFAVFKKLPDLYKKIKDINQKIDSIEKQNKS